MRKKEYKKRVILFGSLLSILIVSLLFINFMPRIKAENVVTPAVIEGTSYQGWESANLAAAQKDVQAFLTGQKGKDTSRPYKGNDSWTEGSLAALDKAYQSSLTAKSGASSELSRMLLIETVRKLEKATALTKIDPVIKSLNNFPETSGEYTLEYDLPTVLSLPENETAKYDVMFVLDWSGSMDIRLQGLPEYPAEGITAHKPRLHAKHLITELSTLVLNNYAGSRVRLFGLNAPSTNAPIYVNIDTGFFGNEPGWENKVRNAYNTTVANTADNQVGNLQHVVPIMKAERNPDAIPVIVYLTDFQLYADKYPLNSLTDNPAISYRKILTEFNSLSPAGKQGPIYLAVRYDHNSNYFPATGKARWAGGPIEVRGEAAGYTYDKLQDDVVAGRKNWNWMAVTAPGRTDPKPTPPSNSHVASEQFMEMFTSSLPIIPSRAYDADVSFQNFNYISSSLNSKENATAVSATSKELTIKNQNDQDVDALDSGSFKAVFDSSAAGTTVMGANSKLGASTNGVKFAAKEYQKNDRAFKTLPNLFHPYTEGAIEVYQYKGANATSDPANFELKKTIVGTNYQQYSGIDYPLKDSGLSSLKYGSSLTKAKALAIVKSKLGATEYNKFDFVGVGSSLTAASHKMTFDAAKNVYKLYADSNESSLTVEYYDEATNKKLKGDKTIPGIIGTSYTVDPLKESIPDFDYVRSQGAPLSGTIKKEVQIIKLFYRKSEVALTIRFVDDDGVALQGKGPIVLMKKPNQPVDLTAEPEVLKIINEITSDYYELKTAPPDEKNVMVPVGGAERTYIFKGQVAIGATKEMIFKTGTIQAQSQVLEYASSGSFLLNIADKRGKTGPNEGYKRGQFKITGAVSKQFTHDITGSELKDTKLVYNDGKSDHDLSVSGGSQIYTSNTARPDTSYKVELANQTDKKDGLKLIVPKGSGAIKGNYTAEITWNLVQEP